MHELVSSCVVVLCGSSSLLMLFRVFFQAIQKAGIEALQPDVAVVPGIPGLAEAYYLSEADNKKVGLTLPRNDGDEVCMQMLCVIVMSC